MWGFLQDLFSHLCGQSLAHSWSPGGELLPCCQRCTGVYLGALSAALLHLAKPPSPTSFWRWLNGVFLLFMIPAGFHWLPQGPGLRFASGLLFGAGLVAFLWLPLAKHPLPDANLKNAPVRLGVFFLTLLLMLVGTPQLGASNLASAGTVLTLGTAGGALALALLVVLHLCLLAGELVRWFFPPAPRAVA